MERNKSGAEQLSRRKKGVFSAVVILFPILFLVCLELGLRWMGYGEDVSLFRVRNIDGQIFYQMNPKVKFRYFGASHFSPSTSPDCFKVPKPKGVYRIFCLGGSTTVGYPYLFNGSFVSFLRERLKRVFPDKKIEVINLGMTATNSYTVLDIVRELGKYQPDLIIDYDGHNEFYGALGAASNQTIGSSRFITLAYLRLIHLRTFQLMQSIVQGIVGFFGKSSNFVSRGTVMETMAKGQYIPYGSPIYDKTYTIFRSNLEDIKKYCRMINVPLILGTQVSDLRDQPPFISSNSAGLSGWRLAAFRKFYERGLAFQSKGVFDSAVVAFKSAISMDSMYADAHYRLAQCLDTIGSKHEAFQQFIFARDYDELRFRTDSKFNDLIRSMDDHEHCFVADIESAFESLSPDSLIGHNLITEHLHPTSRGNFIIAKTYAFVMRKHGLLGTAQDWHADDTLNEDALWQDRCVTDLDERIAEQNTEILTSSWPFRNQLPSLHPVPVSDTLEWLAQQVAIDKLDWRSAHEGAINFYWRRGDLDDVAREYETLISEFPLDLGLYRNLAKVYLQEKRFGKMEHIMVSSIEIQPTIWAYRTLGDLMMEKGDAVDAVKYYERTDGFEQTADERLQNGMALSYAYIKTGEFQKATDRLISILTATPGYKPALELLQYVEARIHKGDQPLR
jgi:tetratricopeptide (TPR) repeat protein